MQLLLLVIRFELAHYQKGTRHVVLWSIEGHGLESLPGYITFPGKHWVKKPCWNRPAFCLPCIRTFGIKQKITLRAKFHEAVKQKKTAKQNSFRSKKWVGYQSQQGKTYGILAGPQFLLSKIFMCLVHSLAYRLMKLSLGPKVSLEDCYFFLTVTDVYSS